MLKPVEIEFLVKDNTRSGLSGVSGGIDGVGKDADAATRKIRELEATIARLKAEASKAPADRAVQYARQIDGLKEKLEDLQRTAQHVDVVPKSAPQAIRTFNGLNVSIQQIARELPSLAMGPQMFFLAISNNLPIFADQLAAARKQYEALTAAGQKATPVWRQVLSSIVSWQTALAVGIMLSVTYGKEIGNFVKGLFSAKTALDVAAIASDRFHATMAKGRVDAQKEIVQLNALYRVASDASRPYDERRTAVEKLQEAYPAYFGNMSAEQVMVGEAIDKYNSLRDAIIATAEARAATDAIVENQKQVTLLKQTGDAYDRYKSALDDVVAAKKRYAAADKQFVTGNAGTAGGGMHVEVTPELFALKTAEANMRESRKAFEEELLKLPGGEELWDRIKDEFGKNITDFEEFVRIQNERLLPFVENIAAGQSVEDVNKKVTEARKAAEKAARQRERQAAKTSVLVDQYNRARLKDQQELDDLLVEEQEVGFEKERAAIRNRYAKKKAEYERQEEELLDLIKRLREAGRDLGPDAEKVVMANTASKIASIGKIRDRDLAAVDKDEAASYDRLLEKYETYMQGRQRIAEKYDKDIVKLSHASAQEMARIAEQMTSQFVGNVDLLARPMIDAARLAEKGWQDAGEGIATVFSSQFGIDDAAGNYHEILVTPILPNGEVLSENELNMYIDKALNGAEDILKADTLGLVIAVDVDPDGTAGETLHLLQEKYYALKQAPKIGSENLERARQAKQRALDDFAEQFAGQFPEFEAWADRIVGLSAGKLKRLLEQTRAELKRLQADPKADQNAVAKAQGKVVKLERLIPQVEGKATDTKRWRDLQTVLSDVIDTFDEVGDAIGGAGGEIVAAMGNIAGSALKMMDAVNAYKAAAAVSDTVGMASGVLGGISAALSVISTIAGMFGSESTWERNLRLAREFNEELRIAGERARINSDEFSTIFGDRLFARYKQNIDVVVEALEDLEEAQERVRNRGMEVWTDFYGKNDRANLLELPKTWESVAESIRNMQVQTRHSTWFRTARYKSLGSLLPELFDGEEVDMEMLKKFVEEGSDIFNKLSKEHQDMLREMVEDWETYEEAVEAVRDYLTDIFGDLGETLTDALVDAFENGSDAAGSFVKSVGQALQKLAKDMIFSLTLGPIFENAQKQIEEIAKTTMSDEDKFEKYSDIMGQLIADAMGQQDAFNAMWEDAKRRAEEAGIPLFDKDDATTQTGHAGALQAVTQDAFSRVEGLVTSIQMHAANMDMDMESSTKSLSQSLEQLRVIADNTNSLPLIYRLLQLMRQDIGKMI